MAKKPCSLDLTPDDQTILCADKFGDVYSLPLIPGEYVKPKTQAKKPKPVATTLTVHSKRNLRSLEQQHLHAERAEKAEKVQEEVEEKTALNFEHQLILGHVSMLTDVIAVSLPGAPGSRPRNYILTADRDEHIRVSRGIPQAHVIEQQCLGHTSLISKLCIPSWAPSVLISGGGDSHLLVWNWSAGQLHQSVPLSDSFQDAVISGIWGVSFDQPAGTTGSINIILIGLEGYVSTCGQIKELLLIGEIAPLSFSATPLKATTHSSPKASFSYPEMCSILLPSIRMALLSFQ